MKQQRVTINFPFTTAARLLGLAAVLLLCRPLLRAADFVGPDTCADCHPKESGDWKGSIHAGAYSEKFKKVWKEHGGQPACLDCHTTGHKKGTTNFVHAGVSCESCHGAMTPGHPAEKMSLPVSSAMCAGCHKKSHQEWKLSKHGQKDIRCFDCHNVHSQGLRAGGGDALCGTCHAAKQKDFAHATHHVEGLKCATCHFPAYPDKADAIQGTGAPGHSLSVGAEVCSRCHEEMVHKSSHMNELRTEVSEFKKQMSLAGVTNVFDLKEQERDLQWRLDRAKQSAWLTALLGFLGGLGLGWLGGWYLLRRRPGK